MTEPARNGSRQKPLWLVIVVPFALLIAVTMGLTACGGSSAPISP